MRNTSRERTVSKVVADLRGMRAYYNQSSESMIWEFYEELAELLAGGYVASVEYGFKQDGRRIVSLYYQARTDGSLTDGKSGGVYARADISGAQWFTFLVYSRKWDLLSPSAQQEIKGRITIQRSYGQAPGDGNGYWNTDRSYASQGVGVTAPNIPPLLGVLI